MRYIDYTIHSYHSNRRIRLLLIEKVEFANNAYEAVEPDGNGVPIVSFADFSEMVKINEVDELVIASFTITTKRKNDIVDFCLNHDIQVLNVPPYNKWNEGRFNSKQLQTIKIEDLLERDAIVINNNQIRNQIKGKRVLVTGAAGSIGSEIVRQVVKHQPKKVILLDQSESGLYDLNQELLSKNKNWFF